MCRNPLKRVRSYPQKMEIRVRGIVMSQSPQTGPFISTHEQEPVRINIDESQSPQTGPFISTHEQEPVRINIDESQSPQTGPFISTKKEALKALVARASRNPLKRVRSYPLLPKQ